MHASLLFCLLFAALGFGVEVGASGKDPQEQFADANTLIKSGRFADALPILEELMSTAPSASVLWNLGLVAAEVGAHEKAKQAWLLYRKADPNDWRGRAKLVQSYQALGDTEARDRERSLLIALWKGRSDPELSKETRYCREQFQDRGRKVLVFEYFEPTGQHMVFYLFVVTNQSGTEEFRISLGSYESTNQVSWETGNLPRGSRLYHLDLYRPNRHETHGFYGVLPSYETVRAEVISVLSGTRKPLSSITKGN